MSVRRILLGPVVMIALLTTRAAADVLPIHALVDANLAYGGGEVRSDGNAPLDTGLFSGQTTFGPLLGEGSARAITSLDGSSFLKTYATAYGQTGPTGQAAYQSSSLAGWQDVAFYSGPGQPDRIRLWFNVDGTVTGSGSSSVQQAGLMTFNPAQINLTTITSNLITYNVGGIQVLNSSEVSLGGPTFVTSNYTGGVFSATGYFDAFYDAAFGGYGWGLLLNADADVTGGDVTDDFLNTLSLTKVTLTDGTPISVTFDSGLTMGTVPEPSSVVMLATAMVVIGFLAIARKHRNQI